MMLGAVLGSAHLLAVTNVDAGVFAAGALLVIAGALGVVASRSPVHSALSLVLTLVGVAVLFVNQDAQFLAAVQVIVYAGAIVVLFLFVIMLLGVDRQDAIEAEPHPRQRPAAAFLALAVLVEILLLGHVTWATGAKSVHGAAIGSNSNVSRLGHSIFTAFLLPFEMTSVLLVIAVVGAVVLARRPLRKGDGSASSGRGTPSPMASPEAPAAFGDVGVGQGTSPSGAGATAGVQPAAPQAEPEPATVSGAGAGTHPEEAR
jgi:NADH-quinone oxidoreductase subunit J